MGTPTKQNWSEGVKLAAQMNFRYPQFSQVPLAKIVPTASPEAIELMTSLCAWDPAARPTAAQCLQHPYFQVGIRSPLIARSPCSSSAKTAPVVPAPQRRTTRETAANNNSKAGLLSSVLSGGSFGAGSNSANGEGGVLPSVGSMGPRNARYKAGVAPSEAMAGRENSSQNEVVPLPMIRNMMGIGRVSSSNFPAAAATKTTPVGPGLGARYGLGRRY